MVTAMNNNDGRTDMADNTPSNRWMPSNRRSLILASKTYDENQEVEVLIAMRGACCLLQTKEE